MKVLGFLVAQTLLLFCVTLSNALVNFDDLAPCTLSCLLETFPAANCSLTSNTCQCQNQALKESTTHCMLSNCTLTDTLALGKLQEQVCGFEPQSKQHQMLAVNLVTCSLAVFAVLLRLSSRYLVSKRIWADDIVISVAAILEIPFCGLGAWMILNGLGTHTWDNSAWVVTKIFQLFWIDETIYILILMLPKVSILLFYLRVFPSRGFRIAGNTVLGFVVLAGTVILLCQLLQCLPVQYNWDKSIHNAKCINVNTLTYAHGGINIFQDVLILALPIPWIMRLKLQLNQKIGLMIMFQVGAFACITAIVRVHFLAMFGGTNSTDPLWENANSTMWTAAEVNSAIICSCLPAIRALYKTGRKMASEASSKRKSLTILSGKVGGVFSGKSKTSHSDAIEEHPLDLVEEWAQKDAESDRSYEPITIKPGDLGSTGNKNAYMPGLREEPEFELHYSHPSHNHIASQIRPWSSPAY